MSVFSQPQTVKVKRNTFNLTHDRKFTTNFGQLVPVQVQEVMPGDTFQLKSSVMVRFAPMVSPIMHQVDCLIDHFFVPYRILWPNWEKFIAGTDEDVQPAPLPLPEPQPQQWPDTHVVHPYIEMSLTKNDTGNGKLPDPGDLADYLGCPVTGRLINEEAADNAQTLQVNALPFAAYGKIYNEYYRDEDLATKRQDSVSDGANNGTFFLTKLAQCSFTKDLYTSARPWAQKGSEAMLPISDGTVLYRPRTGTNWPKWLDGKTGQNADSGAVSGEGSSISVGSTTQAAYDPQSTLWVNFSDASIVNLRRAIALQDFLETRARFGSRYIEHLYGQYGVVSSDARLQRPELIGSQKTAVKISEVLNNTGAVKTESATNTNSPLPQGNMAGHGIAYGSSGASKYYCEEFGVIMSIMRVRPRASYANHVPRYMLKNDPFDYAVPKFAHIGEQAVWNCEIGVQKDKPQESRDTWAYQMRYSEYKAGVNTIHGEFLTTMDTWHMGRKFGTFPALNQQFIEVAANSQDFARIFAVNPVVNNVDPIWCQVLNETKVARKLPFFGNPKII